MKVGNRSSLLQYNNVKVIPKSIIYGEKQRAGRPRPYGWFGMLIGRGDPAPTMMRDLWDYADYVL